MQIHQLTLMPRQSRKRIGRGGKRGTTSGRGTKGQKSRSGAHVDPLFEGGRSTFLERLKKVRGFKAVHAKKETVTLARIDAVFADGETVTLVLLVERKLVSKRAIKNGVRIVATGSLKKKLSLGSDVTASLKAKEAFQLTGA